MTKSPQDMIRSSHLSAVVTDPNLPDNPIISCNDAFLRLTGYDRAEVLGRNCRFLAGPGTGAEERAALRSAVEERRSTLVELENYRKDGSSFQNALIIAPIFDSNSQLIAFIGSQTEVTTMESLQQNYSADRIHSLTPRQRQVIKMMAQGKMMKEIAFELGLHERTVKMHRASALEALDVNTSVEAIRIAIEAGY